MKIGSRLRVSKLSAAEQHVLEAEELLSLCIYNGADPTQRAAALPIYDNPNTSMVGARHKKDLVGLVGICPNEGGSDIRHIAVVLKHRRHRIGATFIYHLRTFCPNRKLFAETDNDLLGFYRKHGFTCMSI